MIIIRADRAKAKAVNTELLTSGMVGPQVKFVFSNEWNGLNKTAVFRAGDVTIDVLDSQWDGNICTIPNECLATSGNTITVGIYGCNNNGDLIIPTVYARVGTVRVGANPYGDDNANPSLPVYEQIRSSIGKLSDLDTVDKSNLVAAINEAAKTADNIVTYTEQSLTDEQKAQVRENIGAVDIADLPTVYPHPITRIESLDKTNLIALRNLDSGTYVLYGYFKPFDGSTSTMTFGSSILVSIVKKTSESHVQIFYPNNNCVQYVKITDTSYERKNVYLNDLLSAVRFDEAQELTETQQTQALENIRAVDKYNGLKRYEVKTSIYDGSMQTNVIYGNGPFTISSETQLSSDELKTALKMFLLLLGNPSTNPSTERNFYKYLGQLIEVGIFGDDFWSTTYASPRKFTTRPAELEYKYLSFFSRDAESKKIWVENHNPDGRGFSGEYAIPSNEFGQYNTFYGQYIQPYAFKTGDEPRVNQYNMATDPTSDMQVATKKYVDEHDVQSDWSENDESAPSYIKNRICYEEESTEEVTYSGKIVNSTVQDHDPIPFVLGETVELDVTAGMKINFAPAVVTMVDGKLAAEFYDSTDEHKVVLYTFYETSMTIKTGVTGATSPSAYKITRHVATTNVQTIDPKYLPIVGGYDEISGPTLLCVLPEAYKVELSEPLIEGGKYEVRNKADKVLMTMTCTYEDGSFILRVVNDLTSIGQINVSVSENALPNPVAIWGHSSSYLGGTLSIWRLPNPVKIPAEYLEPETDDLKMAFRAYVTYEGGSFKGCSTTYDQLTSALDSGRPGVVHVTYVGSDFLTSFDAIYSGRKYDTESGLNRYMFYSTADIDGKLTIFELSIDEENILRKEIIKAGTPETIEITLDRDPDTDLWTCSLTYDELSAALDNDVRISGSANYTDVNWASIRDAYYVDDTIYIETDGLFVPEGVVTHNTRFAIDKDDTGTVVNFIADDYVALCPTLECNTVMITYNMKTNSLMIMPEYLQSALAILSRLEMYMDMSASILLTGTPDGYADAKGTVFRSGIFNEDLGFVFTAPTTTAAVVVTVGENGPVFSLTRIVPKTFRLTSSTANSTKQFEITVDDSGTLTAIEIEN